jgi:hypothetical protein
MPETDENGRTNRPRTTDPDASAGWETEYAAQHVDHAIATDGGTTTRLPSAGDRVRDRDSDGGDELVVVETHPDTEARDCWLDAINATVADVNGAYDAAAPVVEAAYVSDIEDRLDGWRSVEDLRDAVSFGALSLYTFPADRLARLPGGERR